MIEYNWTDKEQAIYDKSKEREDDNVSCFKQKFNQSILIGEEKGEKQAKIEVAKYLFEAGV